MAEMAADDRIHVPVGRIFRFAKQEVFEQRKEDRSIEFEIRSVRAKQNGADFFIERNVLGEPAERIQRMRERHGSFEGDASVGRAKTNQAAEACGSTDRSARVGTHGNGGKTARYRRDGT